MRRTTRRIRSLVGVVGVVTICVAGSIATATAASSATPSHSTSHHDFTSVYAGVNKSGELDCNGDSPVQKPLRGFNCTDIRGFPNVDNQNNWNSRFWDNGVYIGHDEPDASFLSTTPGSGNNVQWNLTLGKDPTAAPTGTSPGHDVAHWFELTPAPWLSMTVCDPNSYPQLPCSANSDANAPAPCKTVASKCPQNLYPGGGSALVEMQFYPPGNAPWIDSESCDGTHWCAALTIDSLECTDQFAQCNTGCEEPINFAFVQRNGVPAGPPSPQLSDRASALPNAETLLMNPGDKVQVHMSDAAVPGQAGQKALKIFISDLTTHQSGSMQASAANGFQSTSIVNCSGTPFNFQPSYRTASAGNYAPWTALQTNISTEFETGHFEPCTSVSSAFSSNPIDPSDTGGTYNQCTGAYETAGGTEGSESGDGLCYAQGDTHAGYDGVSTDTTAPVEIDGCMANWFQNGDLDFDGTAYWAEWPTSASTTASLPSSFVESLPTTNGKAYSQLFFQTDVALSELGCSVAQQSKCTVPPRGPGHFYPYWSEASAKGVCTLLFGNVSKSVDTFGKDKQYGTNQLTRLGYPEFEGKTLKNACPAH